MNGITCCLVHRNCKMLYRVNNLTLGWSTMLQHCAVISPLLYEPGSRYWWKKEETWGSRLQREQDPSPNSPSHSFSGDVSAAPVEEIRQWTRSSASDSYFPETVISVYLRQGGEGEQKAATSCPTLLTSGYMLSRLWPLSFPGQEA